MQRQRLADSGGYRIASDTGIIYVQETVEFLCIRMYNDSYRLGTVME
jgi:hypothetical protein